MSDIKINKLGKIISGSYIKVVDDRNGSTGGYYILTSKTQDMLACFDDWVLNWSELENHFRYEFKEIDWNV